MKTTSNLNEWLGVVHQELHKQPLDQQVICSYYYLPTIGSDKFIIFLFKNPENNRFRAFKKYWDLTNIPKDPIFYNLENTGIKTKELNITKEQVLSLLETIEKTSNFPTSIEDNQSLILDGISEKLIINHKETIQNYTWKSSTMDLEILQPIIDKMLLLGKN